MMTVPKVFSEHLFFRQVVQPKIIFQLCSFVCK